MALIVFGVLLVGFALTERRLERAWLTAPLLFTAAGWALAVVADDLADVDAASLHVVAEFTLVLLLFHDASKLRFADLRRDWALLARLLLVALPLVVIAGYGVAWVLLPGLGVGLTLFLASVLAPTDAALGAATVLNPAVPARVRRLLNAESGLNDGLATPVVLVALAIAVGEDLEFGGALVDLGIGTLIGVAVGVGGGRAVAWSRERGWVTVVGRGIAMVSFPVIAYVAASTFGGNGFIAAFVSGVAFAFGAGRLAHEEAPETALETATEILGAGVWFLFGAALGPVLADGLDWRAVVFAVLSLTVLRMVPVFISLLGSGLRVRTVAFIGWFGPRGLASLIFVLLSIEELGGGEGIVEGPHADAVAAIGLTVLLSVVAHGLTGTPLAERYGSWVDREHPAEETAG